MTPLLVVVPLLIVGWLIVGLVVALLIGRCFSGPGGVVQ